MKEQDDFRLDSSPGLEPVRKTRVPSANRRVRAKSALTRRRVRAAAGLVQALSKVKSAGGKLKIASSKLKTTGGKLKTVSARVKAVRKTKCPDCGNRVAGGAKFCAVCGNDVSAPSTEKLRGEAAVKKPMLWQRGAAQLIDRLLPLPFLVLFYPKWIWVVGAFQLFCEVWAGRSPGKLICRMRVVDARSLKRCGPVRGLLRRLCVALGQVAWCRWEWVVFAVAYDLLSFLFVWRDRAGRRIEDHLLGTRVIGEGRYRKLKRPCEGCGAIVPARARFCPHCGKKPNLPWTG
ncbi:MAG: hypothetical protein ACREEM_24935 [Blastocatellia bacterium]